MATADQTVEAIRALRLEPLGGFWPTTPPWTVKSVEVPAYHIFVVHSLANPRLFIKGPTKANIPANYWTAGESYNMMRAGGTY